MSCIACVCNCVLIQSPHHKELDFEGDDQTAINDIKNWAFWCDREVPDIFGEFFGVVGGLITVLDGQFFLCVQKMCC